MLDATPPERDSGSPYPLARTTPNNTGMPRAAFVLSLLSAIGVVVAAVGALWLVTDPNLGFEHGAEVVAGILFVLGVSLLLAILSLNISVAWRRAGGRGWQSVLSIAFASLAILVFAVGVVLFVLVVVLIVLAFSKI